MSMRHFRETFSKNKVMRTYAKIERYHTIIEVRDS